MGRHWHQASSYYGHSGSSTEGQVVIYGGCKQQKNKKGETEFIALRDLTVLSFGK